MGDAGVEPVNTRQLYRLNCRPVQNVPSGGSLRFEMIAHVPATMTSGQELVITWRLAAPRFVQGRDHWGQLKLRIQ